MRLRDWERVIRAVREDVAGRPRKNNLSSPFKSLGTLVVAQIMFNQIRANAKMVGIELTKDELIDAAQILLVEMNRRGPRGKSKNNK
jgi:hypothetical protein